MTAPTQQALFMLGGDPYFSSVKLLMPFEGTNGTTGSPGMDDFSSAAHGTATASGSSVIDTSQFLFGSSSYKSASSGALYADSADWKLSSANSDQFTVECAVRFNSLGTNKVFVAQYSIDGTFAWTLQTTGGSSSEFLWAQSPDGTFASGTFIGTSGAGLTTGVWYRFAADKDSSGKIRVYKDGTMIASSTPANSSIFNSTQQLGIGRTSIGGGSELDGWIDELRITKGVARYASDSGYTVATTPFPRS